MKYVSLLLTTLVYTAATRMLVQPVRRESWCPGRAVSPTVGPRGEEPHSDRVWNVHRLKVKL